LYYWVQLKGPFLKLECSNWRISWIWMIFVPLYRC
jgi:hypothetical protein